MNDFLAIQSRAQALFSRVVVEGVAHGQAILIPTPLANELGLLLDDALQCRDFAPLRWHMKSMLERVRPC